MTKNAVAAVPSTTSSSVIYPETPPPPVPPPPSVVAMVPASARKETNRASIEASMMRATAGPGNASWRAMLEAQAQALLDTAEAAAEADIAEAGARRRPPPRGDGLVRSLPREAADRRTSDDPLPSTSSASLPPALAAPHTQYAGTPPRPSAPPLELLMEAGFFNEPTEDDHPTTNAPPPRDEGGPDRGHVRMTPLAEAAVVLMPVCEAVRTVGPTPAQDEEDENALAGWTVKCGKFMMIGIASLVLVALGTLIGVVVMLAKQDDSVTTSTSSTALMTSSTSTAILTSTTSTAITTSASSTYGTTTPEMNTVSEKSTDFMLVVFFNWLPVRAPRRVLKLEATGPINRRRCCL